MAPRHVALIMDDTAHWAAAPGLAQFEECPCGLEALRRAALAAIELNIPFLTVCFCSIANWSGPPKEARSLLRLLKRAIRIKFAELQANNIRVRVIGARADLAPDLAALLYELEQVTAANTGLTLVIAFNYSARREIASAVLALATEFAAGRLALDEINSDAISARLGTADIPDPDLIVSASGGQRLSDFLLWQAAYAEFVFLPIDWQDFDKAAFEAAIADYGRRDRRFGRIREPKHAAKTAS
jgi:undecaprenyl diphosphate synthase